MWSLMSRRLLELIIVTHGPQAALVKGAFEAQASFLNTASQCKKPSSDQVLAEVVKPISDKICDIQVNGFFH